ncbi:hypothetical protein C8J56DRAFT_324258 [Mycena floridula]|nr:hypothetical protein C8J56DRAFT_324258 [Mycena floridula]
MILFSPSLGETVHIPLPPVHTTSISLCFTATISSQDYEGLGGAKLQLWSDLHGQWSETDFTITPTAEESNVSLLPWDYQLEPPSLALIASIPFPENKAQFSFTYRILYPSGEIKWLGSFGDNGTLLLDEQNSQFVKADGWHSTTQGAASWNTRGEHPMSVGKFLEQENWSIWGIGKDNFLSTLEHCSLMFFAPKRRFSPLVPQTFCLLASPDTTVSLNPQGELIVSGDGSLLLQSYDPSTSTVDAFLSRILRDCPPEFLRSVGTFGNDILLASPTKTPTTVLAIPLVPSAASTETITVQISSISALLPDVSQFSLFSPSNLNVHFFTATDGSITFAIPTLGGQFLISPLATLSPGVQFSILSPYQPATRDSVEDGLPTPPPSPRLKPIAHIIQRTIQLDGLAAASMSDVSLLPGPLSLEIPAEPFESEDSSMLTIRPGDHQLRRPVSQTSLVSLEQTRKQHAFIRYIQYILIVMAIFFSALFRTLFRTSPSTPNSSSTTDLEEESPVVDERTPLLTHVVTEEYTAEVADQLEQESSSEEEAPPFPVLEPSPAVPDISAAQSKTALFFDLLTSSKVRFIQRDLRDTSTSRLVVEFNGKYLMNKEVITLGKAAELVEFEVESAGKRQLKFEIVN